MYKRRYRSSTEPFGSSFISVSISLASDAHATVACTFSFHGHYITTEVIRIFFTPISNVRSVCRYKSCRGNNPACYQLFDCILKIRRCVICNWRYTHFPSFGLLSFAPLPFWASFIVILLISSAVSTDCSQLHRSDSQGPLGKLAAISDCYPNVQAVPADGSGQEWRACWAWDSAHSGFLSRFHQLVFTFFSCRQGILHIQLYPTEAKHKNSLAKPCRLCGLTQSLRHHKESHAFKIPRLDIQSLISR